MIKPLPHHHRHYIKKTPCRKNQGSKHAPRGHFAPGRIVLESSSRAIGARRVAHLGFALCLLPSSMVVLQSHVPCFEGLPDSPQWVALLVVAVGMIAGSIFENTIVVSCLAARGSVIKGWNDFKKFPIKVDMCQFTYTMYAMTLTEFEKSCTRHSV